MFPFFFVFTHHENLSLCIEDAKIISRDFPQQRQNPQDEHGAHVTTVHREGQQHHSEPKYRQKEDVEKHGFGAPRSCRL